MSPPRNALVRAEDQLPAGLRKASHHLMDARCSIVNSRRGRSRRNVEIMLKTVFSVTVAALILSASSLSGQAASPLPRFRARQRAVDGIGAGQSIGGGRQAHSSAARGDPGAAVAAAIFRCGSNETQTDPVEQIAFSFYNDQLFRMVIDYDRQRTRGMTDADMVRAPFRGVRARWRNPNRSDPGDCVRDRLHAGVPISRWGTDDYSVVLFRRVVRRGISSGRDVHGARRAGQNGRCAGRAPGPA